MSAKTDYPWHPEAQGQSSIRVLHVEDDPVNRSAFARLVQEQDLPYQLGEAGTVAEAKAILSESPSHVIVADYNLADGKSDELLNFEIPFILITGSLEEQLAFRMLNWRVEDYLIKDPQLQYLRVIPFIVERILNRNRIHEAEQKLTQQLSESEERFRAVFLNAGLGIVEVDPTTRFLAVNDRMCQIVRRSREDLLRMTVIELTCPDDRPESQRINAELIAGRVPQISYEKRYLRGDGEAVWVRATTSSVRNDNGEFVRGLALVEDITERKRAEEALRNVALFPNENPDPLLRIDRNGILLYGNRSSGPLLEFFGCSEGHMAPEILRTVVESALTEGRKEIEIPYGEKVYSFVVFPIRTRGYANLYGRDITRRRFAEEALARATGRLDAIITSAMDAVISMDSNQKILLFNPAASKMFGISASEAIGQNINLLIPERFRNMHPHFVGEFSHTGVSSRRMGSLGAVSGVRAGGEEFPIEASISQIEVGGEKIFTVIMRDITQRKRTEQALQESESKLRLAIDAADLGTWDWNLETNTLVWSERCKQMFGLAFDDPVNYEVFLDRLHPGDRFRTHEAVAKAIQDKTEYNIELRVHLPDGGVRWINSRGRAFYNDQGQPVRMSGTTHDVTEIALAREALARSRAELERLIHERTTKLRETIVDLEHFSYSITHDMRAPLRAMQSFATLLQQEFGDSVSPQAGDYLRRIEMAASRMDNLIQDSLDYTKVLRDELPLGLVDVGQLLREMIQSYPKFQVWAEQIRVEFSSLKVIGNVAGLTQCFSNLLSNAIKFLPPAATPQVRIWAETPEGLRQESKGRSLPVARIWVEDNGLGIPEEAREKIFRMFHRLHGDREYSGTGIGLAIVRKAVKRMGGEVGVESEPGKGSRFWIELRLAEEIAASSETST